MRHFTRLLLSLCVVVLLCACGQKADINSSVNVPSWQEQYDLGVRYLSEGNYQEAIIAFTAAIEIDPKRAESYSGLAEAYTCAGDLDAAKKALEDGLAATGSEELQALLEEMEMPEMELPPLLAEGVAAEGVSGSLELSNVTYRYEEGGDMVDLNDGAVGGLHFSFTANGPEGLCDVRIATWFDEMPGPVLQEMIGEMVATWKNTGWADQPHSAQDLPAEFEQGRPVDAEELGRTQYVLMIGLDVQCNALGYAIVPVQIPG